MDQDKTTTTADIGRAWAEAQQSGDGDVLSALLAEDFRLVGPLGFVLDKETWLDQYRSGALVMSSVQWDDAEVRAYGGAAIIVGRQTQQARYRGQAADGRFRVTVVAVGADDGWLIAGAHFSPIAEPPTGAGGPANPRTA